MKLGAGVSYHPQGARPPGKGKRQVRPAVRDALARSGLNTKRPGLNGMGDVIPMESTIVEIIRAFNAGGFTPASIIPVLQSAVESAQRQVKLAAGAKSGNVAQLRSDAANNLARAQRMLAQMQQQAAGGDVTVYSNPSPTWAAVKDAVLGPYYLFSYYATGVDAQLDVDRQIPAIIARAILEAPKTFASAVGTGIEYVRDNVVKPIISPLLPNWDIPRWAIWAGAGLAALVIVKPYVSPVLKRLGGPS